MRELTKRQEQCLDLVRESIATRGYPPTLRELGERMGIRSTNGVNDHLRGLEKKGFIVRSDMRSRGIRILPLGNSNPGDAPTCYSATPLELPTPGTHKQRKACCFCGAITFSDHCSVCRSVVLEVRCA